MIIFSYGDGTEKLIALVASIVAAILVSFISSEIA